MTHLRVGVVGLGMGRNHVKGFQSHPGVEVVACADVSEEKRAYAENELGVLTTYESYEEMCEKESLNIVGIAVPNAYHKTVACTALKSGAHVLCEKPMAMSSEEGKEMAACANAEGKRLMINFSYRFTPQAWALKTQTENGLLGTPYYAHTMWLRRRGMPGFGGWFGQRKLAGGGPMIDLGVHRIDLALWLMDYPTPTWVMARMSNHIASRIAEKEGKEFDVEDFATAMVTFSNGASMDIQASWAGNVEQQEIMATRIMGTEGGLLQKNCDGGYSFEAYTFEEKSGCQLTTKLDPPYPSSPSPYYHFADAIINDYPHIATAEEGITVMKLLDAIYESAEKGIPIELNGTIS